MKSKRIYGALVPSNQPRKASGMSLPKVAIWVLTAVLAWAITASELQAQSNEIEWTDLDSLRVGWQTDSLPDTLAVGEQLSVNLYLEPLGGRKCMGGWLDLKCAVHVVADLPDVRELPLTSWLGMDTELETNYVAGGANAGTYSVSRVD
ncbi:MAG: hypothetical protein AAF570_19635, partial [Bacteroidota bacterium]